MQRGIFRGLRRIGPAVSAMLVLGTLSAVVGYAFGGGPAAMRLEPIRAGTAVSGEVPPGWTHRILRSVPRLNSGELDTLASSASDIATMLRTTLLVDVGRTSDGFELRRIGLGNAIPFRGRDVVVTREGPAEVRRSLSTVALIVADIVNGKLDEAAILAATASFALLRTEAILMTPAGHKESNVYYAFLVDPMTGRLSTLCWGTTKGEQSAPHRIRLLAPDLTFDCKLDVAVTRWLGPKALSWSFAMRDLPPGETIQVPVAARSLIAAASAGRPDPETLDAALRELISGR